jgi:tripartite ATP-independent transporter DctM subunit
MSVAIFVLAALALMIIGVPIAFALGAASLAYLLWLDVPLLAFVQQLSKGVDSYSLLALPFFILAGELMNHGGITDKILRFTNALVGHVKGGLAHANVISEMIFSGVTGSAVADAAAIGTVQLKAMGDNGYRKEFSVGLISSAMTIGPVIPPSTIMVVYGIAAAVPIGTLFVGGLIPGVLMGIGLMLTIAFMARRGGLPKLRDAFDMRELVVSMREATFALLAPVAIIGGIVGGVFTATEAGAVAVAYCFLVGKYWYRELQWRHVFGAFTNAMMMTATILIIMGMSNSFAWLLAFQQVPAQFAEQLLHISRSPEVILLLLMGMYLVLGCFMEAIAIVVMTIPVVMPVLAQVGVDPVHFGVLLAVNMALGTITPPLGIVMYVICDIAKVPVDFFARSIWPFTISLVVVLILLTLVPSITLALPRWVGLL